MLLAVMTLADTALGADSPAAVSSAFHDALAARGVSYLQTRLYRRPRGRLTSASHWRAGGFVARYARPGWVGSTGFDYICFEQNPLLEPIARSVTRYRWSEYAPHATRGYGRYWEALADANIAEAVGSTAYGRDGRIASLHIGLPTRDVAPAEVDAIATAGTLVAEKLIGFDPDAAPDQTRPLTVRERDAIAFVAEGKTDWEIATILGITEATARFHVDNARKKLGATNRAHAAVRFVALHGFV